MKVSVLGRKLAAVALAASLVDLRVLDHHGGLGDDAGEQLDLLARERLEQAISKLVQVRASHPRRPPRPRPPDSVPVRL